MSSSRSLALMGVSVTIAAVIVVLLFWLRLWTVSLDPEGAACYYELDPGSGPSGTGAERIDWNFGVAPTRFCEYTEPDSDPDDSGREPHVYEPPSVYRDVWPLVALTTAAGFYILARRRLPSGRPIGA